MAIRNNFVTASLVLAAAVADAGTFTLAYPTGSTQLSFTAGLNGTAHYAIFNGADRWAAATPGIAVAFGASLITVTNNTGYSLAAGTTVDLFFELKKGNSRIPIVLPLPLLVDIATGDIVTEFRPGIAGTIEYWEFVQMKPVTTGSKLASLNLEIDTTNVTGGVIALTSALCTPMGKVIPCSDITALNVLTRDSKLSIEASGVTAFAEGSGYVIIYIRPTENVQG